MPKLKPYITDEDYKHYEHAMRTNKTGLDHLDEHVYTRMFGYKNVTEYYTEASIDVVAANIAVPTFCFEAQDDMLCHHRYVPFDIIERDPKSNICVAASRCGAHACHITGNRWWFKPQSFY